MVRHSTSSNDGGFGVARLNPDGSPDTSFGGPEGVTSFGGSSDPARAVALRPDGRIVVAGLFVTTSFSGDFAVAQYNADGGLDASFGDGGKTTTDFGGNSDAANAVAIQSDGRVIAAGVTSPSSGLAAFALARYTERPSDTTPPEITVHQGDGRPGHESCGGTSHVRCVRGRRGGRRSSGDVQSFDRKMSSQSATHRSPATRPTLPGTQRAQASPHVKGAAEQFVDLGGAVVGVGPGDSLADKVGEAAAALRAGDRMTASSILMRSSVRFKPKQANRSATPRPPR